MTIKQLSGRQLELARQVSQEASMEAFQRMGGAKFQQELVALGDATTTAELVAKAQADPLIGLDRLTVLTRGIVAWTYPEPPSQETIEDLIEEAAEFIARAIVGQMPAARKNGFGASTPS